MDQRDFHPQPLGICHKLYYFITKTLASQALKTVTLGRSTPYNSTSTAPKGSESEANKVVRSETSCNKAEDRDSTSTNIDIAARLAKKANKVVRSETSCNKAEDRDSTSTNIDVAARLAKKASLRKSVSISDNVEEILPNKRNKKRSKSFQKSSSLDQEEEPKPLRSILKVDSDLKDKFSSIC
ncbi:uncharacterized protein LOC131634766 [Vicia villosa]|uniref:uncharacterized protein LOC131634766 n=1 Tax=Vicia villosa TaxID=3911 RepID=UPI00273C6FB7|nr:uncharacterized protein LOC131634766 [Vicia villosa]